MKKTIFLFFLFPLFCISQNYVDLVKIGYGQTFNNDFEQTPHSTEVKTFEADITFPVIINDDHVFITGGVFSRNNLQLYPNDDTEIFYFGVDENRYASLYSTTLKLGLASTWSEKWSSTVVLLPKIASDYKNISSEDVYFGGVALLKLQKRENLIYRFGVYGSTEAFGFFTTPIFGWYYLSPNKKFEMDTSLPIAADMNYCLGTTTIGFDYTGIGRSFRLHDNFSNSDQSQAYVDLSSLDFAAYVQFNTLQKSVLLRAKVGYSTSNYEVYADGDEVDLGLSAFTFGDERAQLNPDISGGAFLKFEAIYRFQIKDKEQPNPEDE